MTNILDSTAAPVSLAVTGDGSPNGTNKSGAVSATASGALRYMRRPSAPSYYLRWAPPVLTSPTTVAIPVGGQNIWLDNSKDYILQYPTSQVQSQVKVVGGRNIVIMGGYGTMSGTQLSGCLQFYDNFIYTDGAITTGTTLTSNQAAFTVSWVGRGVTGPGIPAGTTISAYVSPTQVTLSQASTNASGITFTVWGMGTASLIDGRTIHIEGVLIDASGGLSHDGMDFSCPSAYVQIQNCRVTGIQGQHAQVHADCIQTYGGWKELRIDHFTGTTDYQGLFIPHSFNAEGPIKISNLDMSYWRVNPYNPVTYLLWMDQQAQAGYSVELGPNVYISNNRGQNVAADSVWPTSSTTPSSTESNGRITFPNVPWITGSVIEGPPPGGEATMVPLANVGIGYVSPGYAPAKQANAQAMFIEDGTTNVVTNPLPASVTGFSGYNSGATVTQDSDTNGNRLHVVTDGTVTQQGMAEGTKAHAAAQGQTWTASCYIDGDGVPLVMEIVERNSSGSFLTSQVSTTIVTGPASTRYTMTYTTTNASTSFIQIRVRVTGSTALATTFNVRKLQLEQKTSATTYCDGSQAGCSWTGTANASSSTRLLTRVQLPVATHLNPTLGAASVWCNLPALIPLAYIWSGGTPNTAGQDFIGVRVNAAGGGIELVAQTGTNPLTVIALGGINTNTWVQVNATWSGTALAGSLNDTSFSAAVRSAPVGSFNTPIELGGLTDNTGKCNGYVGPFLAFPVPLRLEQFVHVYQHTGQWNRSMLLGGLH